MLCIDDMWFVSVAAKVIAAHQRIKVIEADLARIVADRRFLLIPLRHRSIPYSTMPHHQGKPGRRAKVEE